MSIAFHLLVRLNPGELNEIEFFFISFALFGNQEFG